MNSRTLPLFPLPETILFPGQIMPLHIFEPRYRQMTQDLLDGPGELIIGTVLEGDRDKLSGVAPVCPVGGVGRLEKYERLDDGRFQIIVLGQRRVQIRPIEDDSVSYPVASFEDFVEQRERCSSAKVDLLRESLQSELERRGVGDEVTELISLEQMADWILMSAALETEQRYSIYSTASVIKRVEQTLQAIKQHSE